MSDKEILKRLDFLLGCANDGWLIRSPRVGSKWFMLSSQEATAINEAMIRIQNNPKQEVEK